MTSSDKKNDGNIDNQVINSEMNDISENKNTNALFKSISSNSPIINNTDLKTVQSYSPLLIDIDYESQPRYNLTTPTNQMFISGFGNTKPLNTGKDKKVPDTPFRSPYSSIKNTSSKKFRNDNNDNYITTSIQKMTNETINNLESNTSTSNFYHQILKEN